MRRRNLYGAVDTSGNFGAAVPVDTNMTSRARTLAMDNAGNIYFTEDSGLKGAYYLAPEQHQCDAARYVSIQTWAASSESLSMALATSMSMIRALVFLVPLQAGVPCLQTRCS